MKSIALNTVSLLLSIKMLFQFSIYYIIVIALVHFKDSPSTDINIEIELDFRCYFGVNEDIVISFLLRKNEK